VDRTKTAEEIEAAEAAELESAERNRLKRARGDDDDDENGAFAGRDDFDDVCDSDLECVTGTDGEDDGEDEDNLVTNGTDGTEMEGDVVVSGVREDETREEKETETENPEPDPPVFQKLRAEATFPKASHCSDTHGKRA